jgi:hypothetical protein
VLLFTVAAIAMPVASCAAPNASLDVCGSSSLYAATVDLDARFTANNLVCLNWHVLLQVDPSIYRQYCAAFCGLYYSCKKNNKVCEVFSNAAATFKSLQLLAFNPKTVTLK